MKLRQWVIITLVATAIIGARLLVLETLVPREDRSPPLVELSRAVDMVKQGTIARVLVDGDRVELVDRSGVRLVTHKEGEVSFLDTLLGYGATPEQMASIHLEVVPYSNPLDVIIPFVLVALVMAAAAYMVFHPRRDWALNRPDMFSLGRSMAREKSADRPGISFDDVAGAEEAKQELLEVVEFLRSPARFSAMGARVPRGLLLVGPPGTGKTLLARATAGEAGVHFLNCSGSEFVEMFVGVGAARIRDLFQKARKSAPCIVFIDEIDAIGRRRNSGSGNEEREQSLNQILVEMDGFDPSSNVVVMAATNRPDVLDPALLRPGRFDRRIVVDSPDVRARLAILRVHSRGKPLTSEVALEQVARQTTGFSGADLENVMNEAALLAARRRGESIGRLEVEEAVDRVLVGLPQKSRVISEREKRITAFHEAGHALVAHELPDSDPVQRISIIPRGGSGGHTRLLPVEDRHLWSRAQLCDAIAFALGGMAAEQLVFGDTTTGSANDLVEATKIARKMVCLFGMSRRLGPMVLGELEDAPWSQELSENTTDAADAETRVLLEEGRERARVVLERERPRMILLAERLLEQETLQGDELQSILERAVASPESVGWRGEAVVAASMLERAVEQSSAGFHPFNGQ